MKVEIPTKYMVKKIVYNEMRKSLSELDRRLKLIESKIFLTEGLKKGAKDEPKH